MSLPLIPRHLHISPHTPEVNWGQTLCPLGGRSAEKHSSLDRGIRWHALEKRSTADRMVVLGGEVSDEVHHV